MSIIDPVTCGFVKIYCYNLFTSVKKIPKDINGNPKHKQSFVLQAQYKSFMEVFPQGIYGIVEYNQFTNNFKKIVKNLQTLGKQSPGKKKYLLELFSQKSWKKTRKKARETHYSRMLCLCK